MPLGPIGAIRPAVSTVGFVDAEPQLTAEERHGDPADPRHGLPLATTGGVVHHPYLVLAGIPPSGPYGVDAQLAGDARGAVEPAGTPSQDPDHDYSPDTHARPWPKGVETSVDPDAVSRTLIESASIHSADVGASRRMVHTHDPQQDQWVDFYTVDPGSTVQDPTIPPQLKSQRSTDRVSSFANQNEFGFDSAHSHRRWAVGSIPGNYMWMRPGGRPMIKTTPGPSRPPVGEDSPFTGQNLAWAYGLNGAVLTTPPVDYEPPPEPFVSATYPAGPEPAPVGWF